MVYVFCFIRNIFGKINSSMSLHYVNIHVIPQGYVIGPILFIIYLFPIKSIFHKYRNIHYHLYTEYLQVYTSFPSSSYFYLIQITMFNCITDLTEWFSHNYLSLNMTKTNTKIFSRPSSPLSITQPFLLSLPTSESITTLNFTLTSN